MKYGLRERLSGTVILIALAVIFVPMLFDEPAPRSERPQPVMTIEKPVEVERHDVPDPQPPSSLGQIRAPDGAASPAREAPDGEGGADAEQAEEPEAVIESLARDTDAEVEARDEPDAEDPIAALARAADRRLAEDGGSVSAPPSAGEWVVQVGSFGQAENAERLATQLGEQGFEVFQRRRDSGLTSVYVGPFATSREGEQAMAELKAEANLQGLLVRAGD